MGQPEKVHKESGKKEKGSKFSPSEDQKKNDDTLEENNPYWSPNQNQTNQNSINMLRKNYIELPLGEIPEMKESFYDEASRWSQVFATANQSRNKTPDVMTSLS